MAGGRGFSPVATAGPEALAATEIVFKGIRVTSRKPPAAVPGHVPGEVSRGFDVAAAAWLILFSLWFYSLDLPNNRPSTRLDVLQSAPFHLLDVIDPPEIKDAPPGGWTGLLQRLPLMLVAAGLAAGAWGWGRLVLRGCGVDAALTRAEALLSRRDARADRAVDRHAGTGSAGIAHRWLVLGLGRDWIVRRRLGVADNAAGRFAGACSPTGRTPLLDDVANCPRGSDGGVSAAAGDRLADAAERF